MSLKRTYSLHHVLLVLGILWFPIQPIPAEASQDILSGTKLYKTCLEQPENEQCQGITMSAIPLDDKAGIKAGCETKSCKVDLQSDRLLIYIKRGGELTQEISIPFNRIILADLQFWKHSQWHNTLYIPSPKDYQKFNDDFNPKDESRNGRPKNSKRSLLVIHHLNPSPSFSGARSASLHILANSGFGIYLKNAIAASHSPEITNQLLSEIRPISKSDSSPPDNLSELRDQLLATKSCVGCNLRSVDLSGQDLTFANLEGADLTNANLKGTELNFSNLVGANFSQANLDDADLKFANLLGAVLDNSSMINARISHTVMQYSSLQRANLSEVRMKGAMLDYANLRHINLSEADSDRAEYAVRSNREPKNNPIYNSSVRHVIRMTSLRHANLEGANLSGARLETARFDHSNLLNTNFSEAKFSKTYFFKADLTDATLSPSSHNKLRFCATILPDRSMGNADCTDAD